MLRNYIERGVGGEKTQSVIRMYWEKYGSNSCLRPVSRVDSTLHVARRQDSSAYLDKRSEQYHVEFELTVRSAQPRSALLLFLENSTAMYFD